jgi:hypothetical protein
MYSVGVYTHNSYFYHSHLLFQFILTEFVDTYSEALSIQVHYNQLTQVVKQIAPYGQFQMLLEQIAASMVRLVGHPKKKWESYPWHTKVGTQTKHREYFNLFCRNRKEKNSDFSAIHTTVNRAWDMCYDCLLLIYKMQQVTATCHCLELKPSSQENSLCKHINRFLSHIQRLAKQITKAIYCFRNDENILFFLLLHKEQFDKLYGPQYLVKLFAKLYPNGIEEAADFIVKKYSHRGFDMLLPIILEKLAELQSRI